MKKTVSIYGYGRFGKLWAEILAEDFNVKVYSRRGLKKNEVSPNVKIVSVENLFKCDAMFFCVAISSFEEVLIESKKYFDTRTIYFDTCSVKVFPVKWMQQYIPENCQIIATHPMFGPDSYKNPKKLPLVMSNISAKPEIFEWWKEYFSGKRMRIEKMTPEEHDKIVAYSQGITHYIGRVLSDINLQPTNISTVGYNKLLEIIQQTCNDNIQLFIDLQRFNPYTKYMREDLHKSIEKIYSLLNQLENNGVK